MSILPLKSYLRRIPLTTYAAGRLRSARDYVQFLCNYNTFARLSASEEEYPNRFPLSWKNRFVRLGEGRETTDFDPHYVYHLGWALRTLARIRPHEHVDISSSLFFSVALSAFMPVKFYEFRPAPVRLNGLSTFAGNLMHLPMESNSVTSLSCMHVVEHIGLGRYGDLLDPQGDLKSIAELKRVLAPGGSLLFVTPTGKTRLCFNAHRIYSYEQIIEYFAPFELEEFALLPDDYSQGMIVGASPDQASAQNYGCGCYLFKKQN